MTASANHTARLAAKTAGLILAGGGGMRIGGNKPFRELAGRPLIAHVIDAAGAQCSYVMISANAPEVYESFNLPVIGDRPEPGQGPLGGVLGGLAALPDDIDWLVTFPVDCPVVPDDMVARMLATAQKADAKAAFASHADRDHYLSSIWHRDNAPVIAAQLADDNRRVGAALRKIGAERVVFTTGDQAIAPFANVNSQADLAALNALMTDMSSGRGN